RLFAAVGRIPSGAFVLTVRRGEAETGMLVSWVQQCAFDPPHVSIALKHTRPIIGWLTPGTPFILNILDREQKEILGHFGRGFALDEAAFSGLAVERNGDGAPVLREAHAYLECVVASRVSVADHELFLAEVMGGSVLHEGHPMIHVRKSGAHY